MFPSADQYLLTPFNFCFLYYSIINRIEGKKREEKRKRKKGREKEKNYKLLVQP